MVELDIAHGEDCALGTLNALGPGETPIIGIRGFYGQELHKTHTPVIGIGRLHDQNEHKNRNKDLYDTGTPWSYGALWENNHNAHKWHNKEYDSSCRGHKPENRNKKKQIKNKRT